MKQEKKWILNSNRAVEDVIFFYCGELEDDHFEASIARSFVIDMSDESLMEMFTNAEKEEIRKAVLPMPAPNMEILGLIKQLVKVRYECGKLISFGR